MKPSLPVLGLATLLPTQIALGGVPPLPSPPPPPPMPAPQISGVQAAVLLDVQTDQVLMDEHGNRPLNPSGLVKLMTAYLLLQAEHQGLVRPDQNVQVSDRAWHAQGSRMFIQPGLPVTVAQLERGLLIDGGNDAAIVIAQTVAGSVSGFVDLMNRDAAEMGLKHTHFANPDGLPAPDQRSTALDVARLARILIENHPSVLQVAGQPKYTYNHITQYNYNPLAGEKGINGLGVGLASSKHWDLAVSASRDGRSLVAVVLGAASRSSAGADASALLHYGFHGWQQHAVYAAGARVGEIRHLSWSPETLAVTTPKAIEVAVPRGGMGKLSSQFVPAPGLALPIRAKEVVGQLELRWQGRLLKSVPVQAAQSVHRAGFVTRLWHRVRAWL